MPFESCINDGHGNQLGGKVMEKISIGDFEVSKIVESVGPIFELNFLLPEATEDVVEANRDWLYPTYIDPGSGMLVLSIHSYLVKTGRHTILIDACSGNDKERPSTPEMHRLNTDYLQKLEAFGVTPADIDFVMCTHMHPDHVGWNTRLDNGEWVPTFPNARYLFGKTEYQAWKTYHEEVAGTEADPVPAAASESIGLSFRDSVLPIIEAGRAEMIEDGFEVEKGIQVEAAVGHSPGNFVIHLVSGDERALASGDVLHHPLQLPRPDWSSGFCSDPVMSAATRKRVLESVVENDSLLMPAHFPSPSWVKIGEQAGGFRIKR